MALEINPEKARERIDEFLDQIDDLLDKRYDQGKEEKRTMSTKLDNFAEVAFSDGENKKNALYSSAIIATSGKKSPREKQKDYEDSLKRKKRNLEAWKEQIELEEGTKNENKNSEYAEVKEEISKLEDNLPIYARDLEQSIEELRSAHFLSSVMITGRVIDHTIDQIKSSQGLGGPEEVLDHLVENDIINTREGQIADSIKSYRDVFAHEVGKSPDFFETRIILLGCIQLLRSIQDAEKTREYDLA